MLTNTRIFVRLAVLVLALMAFIGGVATEAIVSMSGIQASLKTVYEDRTVPLVQLAEIMDLFGDVRESVGTINSNAATSEKASAESEIITKEGEIAEIWKSYLATYLTPEEKKLAATATKVKDTYIAATRDVITSARSGTTGSRSGPSEDTLRKEFAELNEAFDALKQLQADVAKEEFEKGQADYNSAFTLMLISLVGAIVIGAALAFLIARSITAPLGQMISVMNDLTNGNLNVEVSGRERGDELGEVARAVAVFKDGMIDAERMRVEQAKSKERAEAERKGAMHKMAADFESAVGGIVKTVASAATELQASAESLAATAQETSQQATVVSSASTQVTSNIQTVSAAAEELTASVQEIGRQISSATAMTGSAVIEAGKTNTQVQELAHAAQKINDVVALINNIASQTNLLALNATIEAARAGEAGKGFAVVASEVKNLATQTARATGDIGQQISEIQRTTQNCVVAIHGISETIGKISAVASAIAIAVEEQSSATQEIARNVNQAAQGSGDVAENIVSVNQASELTGASAGEVLGAARELSTQAELLNSEMSKFLDTIRQG